MRLNIRHRKNTNRFYKYILNLNNYQNNYNFTFNFKDLFILKL